MDLNDISRKTLQSQSDVTELKAALRQLLARVDRQALIIGVLKDMMLAGSKSAEAEFLDRLAQATTQKAEGNACRKCGKAMSPKHSRCMYCGEARPAELL